MRETNDGSYGPYQRRDHRDHHGRGVTRDGSRGVIGPLLLILLGIALLLDSLGVWSPNWRDVWRLWPVLLVLAGLQIIFSRTAWGGLVSLLAVVAVIVGAIWLSPPEARARVTEEVIDHPAHGIASAAVRADLGIGTLEVSALEDSDQAFELRARYDRGQVSLTHDVQVEDGIARVRLGTASRRTGWSPLSRSFESDWRLMLNPEVPMQLDISTGVSSAHLALERLALTRLTVNAGVGEVRLTLPAAGRYEVSVDGGVGALAIDVPEGVEARVRLDRGLGAVKVAPRFLPQGVYYVTAGYEDADNRAEIDIDGGVGSITIR
jgi:hypothetical protein